MADNKTVCCGPDISEISLGGNRYYIKLRPFVKEFLKEASKLFVLHIDTAATREYAEAVSLFRSPSGAVKGLTRPWGRGRWPRCWIPMVAFSSQELCRGKVERCLAMPPLVAHLVWC